MAATIIVNIVIPAQAGIKHSGRLVLLYKLLYRRLDALVFDVAILVPLLTFYSIHGSDHSLKIFKRA